MGTAATQLTAVVVTHDSADVLAACLDALATAAPRRGVDIRVVDNASGDGSADLAAQRLGSDHVVRLHDNRGFAAGVNVVARAFAGEFLAVLNPDALVPPGGLDALADVLDGAPRAGLVAPRVVGADGRPEATVGHFPTLAREWRQAWGLTAAAFGGGRRAPFPERAAAVEWVSGCAWLLRGDAVRAAGPLHEDYFMYWEDVDYCRVLHDAGWDVWATPTVTVRHAVGTGSRGTAALPADGGLGLVEYFRRFHPAVAESEVRRVIACAATLRAVGHTLRGWCGVPRAAQRATRYRRTLALLRQTAESRR